MVASDGLTTSFRRRTVLAAVLATLGLAASARAYASAEPVDLSVVNRDTGQVLQVWRHHGRLFVAGDPGARYSLRVTNHTDGRVMVVLSVDGVNILTGETASYNQRGYVFAPYESYDLTGWRKSNTEVAAFAFAPLRQSYAALTGRPTDVGVIGMAVFKERVAPPEPVEEPVAPMWRDQEENRGASDASGSPAPRRAAPASAAPQQPPADKAAGGRAVAALAQRPDERLGTAHGARERSVVNITSFERATPYPQSVRQIQYDTYANLVACGVIPVPRREDRPPRPFPLSPDGNGYVPDPPG